MGSEPRQASAPTLCVASAAQCTIGRVSDFGMGRVSGALTDRGPLCIAVRIRAPRFKSDARPRLEPCSSATPQWRSLIALILMEVDSPHPFAQANLLLYGSRRSSSTPDSSI